LYACNPENFIVIYVDDLLLFAPKKQLTHVGAGLARRYEMHNLGKAHWFLMMETTHDQVAQMITIDQ